jgi:hypothetical protein
LITARDFPPTLAAYAGSNLVLNYSNLFKSYSVTDRRAFAIASSK